MSPGKRLTLEQKKCVSAHYLNPKEWMLKEETEFYLKIIHKITRCKRQHTRRKHDVCNS